MFDYMVLSNGKLKRFSDDHKAHEYAQKCAAKGYNSVIFYRDECISPGIYYSCVRYWARDLTPFEIFYWYTLSVKNKNNFHVTYYATNREANL